MMLTVGYFSLDKTRLGLKPKDSQSVPDEYPLWISSGSSDQLRVIAGANYSLKIIGRCFADNEEILRAAYVALRLNRWKELMSFGGAYIAYVSQKDTVRVVGSLSGLMPVYFLNTKEGYLWSNTATCLAAYNKSLPDIPLLISNATFTGINISGRSSFQDIRRVPPGWMLHLSARGHTLSKWYEPRVTKNFHKTADTLRSVFCGALEQRAQSAHAISADLSGGLDSSTIASFTAGLTDLTAITYGGDDVDQEDLRYAKEITERYPSMRHEVLGKRKHSFYFNQLDELDRVPFSDFPSIDLALQDYYEEVFTCAARNGSKLHMSGAGGDQLLDPDFSHTTSLLIDGQWSNATKRTLAHARMSNISPWRSMLATLRLAHTPYTQSLHQLAREICSPSKGRLVPVEQLGASGRARWCDYIDIVNWLTPTGRQLVGQLLHELADQGETSRYPAQTLDWYLVWWQAHNLQNASSLASRHGIYLDLPFLDSQVLDTCLSLLGCYRTTPYTFKPLLKTAMRGLVPEQLLGRTTKGHWNQTFIEDVTYNQGLLRKFVAESNLVEQGFVHSKPILTEIDRIVSGMVTGSPSLMNFVTVETWLRTVKSDLPTWWEVSI